MASPEDLTKLFLTLRDQFTKKQYDHYWQTNPFAGLIPKSMFDNKEGLNPTVINLRHTLPTSYPTDLNALALSNGTGSSCEVTATEVNSGQDTRNYGLKVDAWESPVVCLTDLEFSYQAKEVIRNVEEGLTQYAIRRMADWYRIHNISMVDNKWIQDGAGSIKQFENSNENYDSILVARASVLPSQSGASSTEVILDSSASSSDDAYNGREIHIINETTGAIIESKSITDYVGSSKTATVSTAFTTTPASGNKFRVMTTDLPTNELDWGSLKYGYDELERRGANSFAVGKALGEDIYPLCVGPEIMRKLFASDTDLRETVKYWDPVQNFTSRGINHSVNGFVPNKDSFPIRLDAAGQFIYPSINIAATEGTKNAPNPAYKPTTASGGSAVYEVATILPREIYECHCRVIDTTRYHKAGFDAINYTAEIDWINNRTFKGSNDQGNKGYFRADWQLAAKPIRPEMGVSLLYKIS